MSLPIVADRGKVWKKFFILKAAELGAIFGIIPTLIFAPYYYALLLFNIGFIERDMYIDGKFAVWLIGVLGIIATTVCIGLIGFILYQWMKLNWKWAINWAATPEERTARDRKDYGYTVGDKVYIKTGVKQYEVKRLVFGVYSNRYIVLNNGNENWYTKNELTTIKPKPKPKKDKKKVVKK